MPRRTALALPLLVALLGGGALAVRSASAVATVPPSEVGAFGFAPGELVPDFSWRASEGGRGTLSRLLQGKQALVLAVRTTECPVSQKYGHRLAKLEREYAARGVGFAYLTVSPQDTRDKVRQDIETFGFEAPYLVDRDGRIASALQVKVSTEVFVIDPGLTLRYRGAVDDQFGVAFSKPEPGDAWLEDALEDVLAHRKVAVAATEASGCFVEGEEGSVPRRDITYHTRVSRIVQDNCVGCHREGGVAPFALDSYQQLHGFRHMVKWVVEERRMPPWFASPEHGAFRNDRTLTERDRRDLLAWIEAGAPEGDPAAAPAPYAWVSGWQLDEAPDAVVQIPEPEEVPAEGVVDYRYVYVKTDFGEDRWIRKVEPRPTAKQVTHHIIVYQQGPDDENRGRFLAGTAPGVPATVFPEGTGKKLPAGAWLMFELHYTPNGTATTDQSMVGFVFADEPPEREVETNAVATTDFRIPPHAADHEVVAEMTFKRGGEILAFLPHMHLRGKSYRYEMVRPDSSEEVLLDVPRYDFNWQLWYELARPLRVEPGTVLRGRARYDNSADNPANPDPSVEVEYGEQSFEEMMFGFFDWVPDPRQRRSPTRGAEPTSASSPDRAGGS